MIGRTMTATSLALGLAVSASATTAAPTPPVRCEIDVVQTASGVLLRPVAQADRGLIGSYQLSVETSGDGGSSQVSQGGDFALRAGQRDVLGSVSLGRASDARIRARLELTWAGGRTHCIRRL